MTAQEIVLPPVLKNTYSTTELHRRADLLQRFFEHLFFESKTGEGDRVALLKQYYHDADENMKRHVEAVAAWGAPLLGSFTAGNLYERVLELKQAAKALPTLTLYVPTHLTSDQIQPIGIWCRAYVRSDIMLEIKTDPEAIGGCEFAYNDRFHDFSFSYFAKAKRSELVKLVHEYDA
jgi:F0F1-type ATP synthase delta subunit